MVASPTVDGLRAAAETAMRRAYAPYSAFRVGAVLRADDGALFAGCNVENSASPAGTCAERGALSAAVAAGRQRFTHLVICTEAGTPTPPCGMCRQALAEFAPDLEVTSITSSGTEACWSLADLLPSPFSPQSLHRA